MNREVLRRVFQEAAMQMGHYEKRRILNNYVHSDNYFEDGKIWTRNYKQSIDNTYGEIAELINKIDSDPSPRAILREIKFKGKEIQYFKRKI